MMVPRHRRPTPASIAVLVVALAAVFSVVACRAPAASGPASSAARASNTAASAAAALISPSPSAAAALISPSPSAAADSQVPIDAARAFLGLRSATFALTLDRWRPDRPLDRIWDGTGAVEPVADRGSMRFRLFPAPVPAASPAASGPNKPDLDIEIVWNSTDWWSASRAGSATDRRWTHTTRPRAREAAIIGRIQDEALALIRFAAEADPSTVSMKPTGTLNGGAADRWLIQVPLERARAAYVPPDSYLNVAGSFGVSAFPLDIWTRDGVIVRSGYVFARDKAPYGGPDRSETYYDWSHLDAPIDLESPPSGRIVELPN